MSGRERMPGTVPAGEDAAGRGLLPGRFVWALVSGAVAGAVVAVLLVWLFVLGPWAVTGLGQIASGGWGPALFAGGAVGAALGAVLACVLVLGGTPPRSVRRDDGGR